MHTTLRTTLICSAALLACNAFAQSAPSVTVYGRLDMSLESNTDGAVSRTAIQNFSSRLGFKGEKAFNGDLKGIFQLETGVSADDYNNSTGAAGADASKFNSKPLASRNSFVGLSSAAAGSLIVGNNDMPLKQLEGTAYALWGEGDLQELIIHGKGSKTGINLASANSFDNVHTRKSNVLIYTSPKFADIVAKLAYSPDEAATATVTKNMTGASLYWDNGVYNAGYAYQSQDNAINNQYALTGNKMILGMKMNAWTLGVAASTIDNNNGRKTSNWLLTGTYALGQTTLKASYGASGESKSGAADDLTAYSLEADYALDKDFTVYGYYSQINNAANAKASFAAADNFPGASGLGVSPHALGLGIRYNF